MPRNLVSSPAWTPRQIVQRAWQVVHTEGLVSLWFKILGECGYRRVVLFVRQFEGQPAHVDTRLPVQLGRLQPDELDTYFALRPEADPDDIRHRLATGHICYTARAEGRLIHVCWITTGHAWIAYLAREIDLAPDDVYSYESFTAPEFRGSNIAAARSMYMQETLHAVGYRRAVAVVMPENRSAYRAVEKAGYRRIGMLRTIWIGKWRRHFGRVAASRSINSAYWDEVAGHTPDRSPYLDPFLGNLKRQAHLDLIARWGGAPEASGVPKWDACSKPISSKRRRDRMRFFGIWRKPLPASAAWIFHPRLPPPPDDAIPITAHTTWPPTPGNCPLRQNRSI